MGLILARTLRRLPHRRIGRLHAALLRRVNLRRSPVLGAGQPVLALTTTGRRTGERHSTALAYVRIGNAYVVGALNRGSEREPQWSRNLRANRNVVVRVEGT